MVFEFIGFIPVAVYYMDQIKAKDMQSNLSLIVQGLTFEVTIAITSIKNNASDHHYSWMHSRYYHI